MRNKIVGIFRCTFAWKQKNIQNIWKLALGLNAIKLKFAVFNYSDEIERVTLSQRALREFWSIPTSLERATLTLFFQFELNI